MAQLNTKIILRNDSTANWEAAKNQVLLKGEAGIEFLADGTAKIKIGDGVKSWAELNYFGGEDKTFKIDENQFVFGADGELKLFNFDEATDGAILTKSEGKLHWNNDLVTQITELDTQVTNLVNIIGEPEEGENPASGLFADIAELDGRIGNNENTLLIVDEDLETLEALVGAPAEGEQTATGIFAELEGLDDRLIKTETNTTELTELINSKADANNVYTKEEVYTKAEVITQIADAEHLKRKIVSDRAAAEQFIAENPLTADQYIYMILASGNEIGEDDNYDEYLLVENNLEKVGNWHIDLTDYATKTSVTELAAIVADKVDKNGTDRLITADEAKKLEKLVISEDGSVEVSGEISAANVQELYDNVVRIVTGKGTYEYDGEQKNLLGIETGAQVNVIEQITLAGGASVDIVDKVANIPLATAAEAGLVKSSNAVNKIAIGTDGTMEVNSLNVNKLVQDEGDVIVLNGGNSSGKYE